MVAPILFSVKDPQMASYIPVWYGTNITVNDTERTDDALFDPGDSFSALNRYLMHNIKCDPRFFVFHGGVLEKNGSAYVFLADSGMGKSTLMAYLSQQGWSYINDDYVIISKGRRSVIPDDYPIHLRIGGLEYLRHEGIVVNPDAYIPYQYSENKRENGKYVVKLSSCNNLELSVKCIFMLDRKPENEGKQRFSKESFNIVIKRLLTASLHAYSLDKEVVVFMNSLIDKCYSLYYTNASDVISLMAEFVR